ncbi:MAG: AIR synthase-related protein [Bacteroidales bacterium]
MPEERFNAEAVNKYATETGYDNEIKDLLKREATLLEQYLLSGFLKNHECIENEAELITKFHKILRQNDISNEQSINIGEKLDCILKIKSEFYETENEASVETSPYLSELYREMASEEALPVACINAFHFGSINDLEFRKSLKNLVKDNSGYNNAIGTPTTGIQTFFDECNNKRLLINSLLVGTRKKEKPLTQKKVKPGDKILILGQIPDNSNPDRIIDKILIDNIYLASQNNLITNVFSTSNYGFLHTHFKVFGNSGYGISVEIQENIDCKSIQEILLSTCIFNPGNLFVFVPFESEKEFNLLFKKTGISFIETGKITESGKIEIFYKNDKLAEIPFSLLKPRIKPKEEKFAPKNKIEVSSSNSQVPVQKNLREIAWFLIKHPNIASKKWIFEQYDSMVGISNMTTNFPSSASVINLKENNHALALCIEGNPRYSKSSDEAGIQIAVSEAARKISCTGAVPLAAQAIFNYPFPENQFDKAYMESIAKSLSVSGKKLKLEIGCNEITVYNFKHFQKNKEGSCSLPAIGMVGLLKDKNHHMTITFKNKGNIIFLIGRSAEDINSSEYLYSYHKVKESPPPWYNLDLEYKVQSAVQELIHKNYICSAHTVSKGGLFISLVESAMRFGLGFDIITDTDIRTDAFLFGESQGRVLVSITPNKEDHFIDFMLKKEVPFLALGHVTKGEMRIDDISFGFIEDAKREYENSFEKLINA